MGSILQGGDFGAGTRLLRKDVLSVLSSTSTVWSGRAMFGIVLCFLGLLLSSIYRVRSARAAALQQFDEKQEF